jgi:isoprenylcysteine carboxyl methyltransferase (ICMT) family protein YpbQ
VRTAWLAAFFGVAVALRLLSLVVSRRHERALRAHGAREHGAGTSRALALLHAAFYLAAFAEGWARRPAPDALTAAGLALYLFAMLALASVLRELGGLWTVKLYLAPEHVLKRGGIFRSIRHPNYVLNLVPELLGLALVARAWWTLTLLLPCYLACLAVRVREEERMMRSRFAAY